MKYCVVTGMRSLGSYVPPYMRMLENFSIKPEIVVIGENDSTDNTADVLLQEQKNSTLKMDIFSFVTGKPSLYSNERSAERSAHYASVRNVILDRALKFDWDYVLMQDARKWSRPHMVERLINSDKDIIAPSVCFPAGGFYDIWCFRHSDGAEFKITDTCTRNTPSLKEIRAVGGVYLVKREVIESGVRLAGGGVEDCDSVALCTAAIAKGFKVWIDRSQCALVCNSGPDLMERYNNSDALKDASFPDHNYLKSI